MFLGLFVSVPPPPDQLIGCGPAHQSVCRRTPPSFYRILATSSRMSPIRDFVAGLARAGKTFKEIQETTEAAYGENALKKTQIYEIIRAVKEGKVTEDQRQNNGRRKVRSPDFVAEIAAEVDEDRRITIQKTCCRPWGLHANHPAHSPRRSGPVKEVR
jgi:hypothetical protein